MTEKQRNRLKRAISVLHYLGVEFRQMPDPSPEDLRLQERCRQLSLDLRDLLQDLPDPEPGSAFQGTAQVVRVRRA